MKKFRMLLLSVMLASNLSLGQQSWGWLNPYPTGLQINQVYFVNGTDGFVIGQAGTLLQTNDGGSTWQQASIPTDVDLIKMIFPDASNGWVLGRMDYYYGARLFSTTDGGTTWFEQTLPYTYGNVVDIFFLDAQNGWIVGESGLVFRTTNGGNSWFDKSISVGDVPSFYFVRFTSSTEGIALGSSQYYPSGFVLAQTTDGGNNWDIRKSGLANLMQGADQIGSSSLVTVGDQGLILQTSNGGTNWSFPMGLPLANLSSVDFYDPLLGMAAGDQGNFVRTTDGGVTWTQILTGYAVALRSIQFISQDTLYAGGSGGYYTNFGPGILVSTDGGNIWTNKARAIDQFFDIEGICFTSTKHGMMAGYNYIYGTADSGITWNLLRFNNSDYLHDIVCIDSLNGLAVGERFGQALVLKTTNGGSAWQTQIFSSISTLQRISFPDVNTGYAVGYNGSCLKTTNQGQSWSVVNMGTTNYLTDVEFTSADIGWVCGGDNLIRKTTDGGTTWNSYQVTPYQYDYIYEINFPDANTGYAARDYGYIYKSTNGGISWSELSGYFSGIRDLVFADANRGWVATYDGILSTTDGGSSWQTELSTSGSINLNRLALLSGAGLWAGGSNTSILKFFGTIPVGIAEDQTNPLPDKFTLSQNYPNPFNPVTNIRFGLPKPAKVKIDVFNVIGQRVVTILDERRPAGYHVVTFDAQHMASGTYFYRIEASEFTETKKMLLLK